MLKPLSCFLHLYANTFLFVIQKIKVLTYHDVTPSFSIASSFQVQSYGLYSERTQNSGDDRRPDVVEYPLQEVLQKTKYAYLNNTVAYALAYAIAEEVSDLHLYGIDFTHKAVNFAEAGRACCEFWCAIAVSKGIKIEVAHTSGLLDTNVPDNERLYGYHRLEDPLVQYIEGDQLVVVRKSEYEGHEEPDESAPEPLDGKKPVVLGLHDIEGVTYVAEKEL